MKLDEDSIERFNSDIDQYISLYYFYYNSVEDFLDNPCNSIIISLLILHYHLIISDFSNLKHQSLEKIG